MIDTAARRARLVLRHHLPRTATAVGDATGDLIALHSSDPLTPHLALWARVPGYRTQDLDDALVERASLWRLHAMRRTIWVAASEEIAMLDAAVGADVARRERRRLVGWARAIRPDAGRWIAALEDLVLAAVASSPGITTRTLTSELPELATKIEVGSGKHTTEVAIASRLLYVMAMELKLRRGSPAGSWKSSQYGWHLAGDVERIDPEPARARLVARYLDRFGPVTEADIVWWAGMTKTRVRKALRQVGAVETSLEEGNGWIAPDDTNPTVAEIQGHICFLPSLDPTPMGYKERDWFLGDHGAVLFDRFGNIGPTVWLDGRIVGGWAVREGGFVVTRLLEDIGDEAEARVEQEAHALTAWLNGTTITPRFRAPLERELAG